MKRALSSSAATVAVLLSGLSAVACDNWWLVKGRVVAAPCDGKKSMIVEKDTDWLDSPTATDHAAPEPIANAEVQMLYGIDGKSPLEDWTSSRSQWTDIDGWFEHEGVYPTDRFGLRVTAPGYQSVQSQFPIEPGLAPNAHAFEVTLRPAGC